MKKIIVAALLFTTLIGYANESITPSVKLDVRKVKVEFEKAKKGQSFTIKDIYGAVIYSQKVKKTGSFSKVFDLTALENGNYTAELNKDFEIVIKPFLIEKGSVTFLPENKQKIFKPVIRNQNNLVFISKIAFDKQPVKVTLYYNNDIILSETLDGGDVVKRAYQLSEIHTGNYSIVVDTNNRIYVKAFKI